METVERKLLGRPDSNLHLSHEHHSPWSTQGPDSGVVLGPPRAPLSLESYHTKLFSDTIK